MNSVNQNRFAMRLLALTGAVGTASLVGLPVLAQMSPSTSEAPYDRSQTGTNAVQCPPGYTTGGIGGPIDSANNQSQMNGSVFSSSNNSSLSSGDVATQGINSPANSNANQFPNRANAGTINGSVNDQTAASGINSPTAMNPTIDPLRVTRRDRMPSNSDQFSANNPRPAVPYRANGPAGTAGREAISNLDAPNSSRTMNNSRMTNSMSNNSMSSSMSNNNQRSSRSIVDGQFSGRNPSAALAFRANGPAGTAGKEAIMSLEAFNRGEGQMMQSHGMGGSYNASSMQTYRSAMPVPVECVPTGGINNQSAPSR